MKQTCVLKDVLEPVAWLLYGQGNQNLKVKLSCPRHLKFSTDPLHLTQVLLSLAKEFSNRMDGNGVIVLSSSTMKGSLHLAVEEEASSPKGFLPHNKDFSTHEGQNLVKILGGKLWVDPSYQANGTRTVLSFDHQDDTSGTNSETFSVASGQSDTKSPSAAAPVTSAAMLDKNHIHALVTRNENKKCSPSNKLFFL